MLRRPLSAVPATTGGWGALGALTGLSAGWVFDLDVVVSWLLLLILSAAPMWFLEWRAHGARRVAATVSSRECLFGIVLVTVLFVGSIKVQVLVGSSKGGAVSLFLLPILATFALLAMVALFRPQLLSPTFPACGRLVLSVVNAKRAGSYETTAFMGWIVKAVFLPLILGWSYIWIAKASEIWYDSSWLAGFTVVMALLYAVDTAFGTVGYLSTSEKIDGHIRSVDRTIVGWVSALACYPPLSVLVMDTWLVYKTGSDWTAWFTAGSAAAWLWGGAIVLLTAIYTWSSVAFGPRFSNLTNRGIITSGPYRWGKHPAYLSKNLSWWLISVPFLGNETSLEAALHCLALLGVNAIYFVRAWSEERHLSTDGDYQAYALWISHHGLVARVKRGVCGSAPASEPQA